MSGDARFRPPGAHVVDIGGMDELSTNARLALGLATAAQLAMFCLRPLRVCLEIAAAAATPPIGFVTLLAGLLCLYAGIFRLVVTRQRGARLLMASIVLQLFTLVSWHGFFFEAWPAYGAFTLLLPLALGPAIAAWGWLVAPRSGRARVAASFAVGDPS